MDVTNRPMHPFRLSLTFTHCPFIQFFDNMALHSLNSSKEQFQASRIKFQERTLASGFPKRIHLLNLLRTVFQCKKFTLGDKLQQHVKAICWSDKSFYFNKSM